MITYGDPQIAERVSAGADGASVPTGERIHVISQS